MYTRETVLAVEFLPLPREWELATGDDLVAVAKTFANRTAMGAEGLHPRAVATLSAPMNAALLQIMRVFVVTGVAPECASQVLAALIPKASGGVRAIGLFSGFYRLWGAMAKRCAERWYHGYVARNPRLVAGPTCSAVDPAWRTEVLAQLAAARKTRAACPRDTPGGMRVNWMETKVKDQVEGVAKRTGCCTAPSH